MPYVTPGRGPSFTRNREVEGDPEIPQVGKGELHIGATPRQEWCTAWRPLQPTCAARPR